MRRGDIVLNFFEANICRIILLRGGKFSTSSELANIIDRKVEKIPSVIEIHNKCWGCGSWTARNMRISQQQTQSAAVVVPESQKFLRLHAIVEDSGYSQELQMSAAAKES